MIAQLAAALLLQAQSAPSQDPTTAQEPMRQAIESMAEIFTTLGSCERHYTPEQIAGVRRAFTPVPGATQNGAQIVMQRAYETGKADTTRSAAFCREVIRTLAASRSRPVRTD